MQAASREAMQAVQRRFDDVVGGVDDGELIGFAEELASLARLLLDQAVLRKYVASRSDDNGPKLALIDRLLKDKASQPTQDVVRTAVEQRWSVTRDLPEALERLARLAVLVAAERDGQIENVEDELFRFGRTLEANPRLAALLSQIEQPADKRVGLLDDVLADKTTKYTAHLLRQSVRLLNGNNIVDVVPNLAELAAARRGESVAHVVAAAPLNEQQFERLSSVLSRIYGRTISVQLDIDPEVLGGLQIRIGDEVVDGTIVSRLSRAASSLPE